jgi:hypothetical protein
MSFAKSLCKGLNVTYNSRTIVVTALTGAAAVSICGETTDMACALNRSVCSQEIEQWKYAYLLFGDRISFADKIMPN